MSPGPSSGGIRTPRYNYRRVNRARAAVHPRRGHGAADHRPVGADPVPDPARARRAGAGAGARHPDVVLEPELVLLIILPPLLYAAAYFTPLRELRRNVAQISMLAVGLVLATAAVVAIVAHEALGFDWAPAFVLGAIVSPTDPIAATAIARRLGAPARIIAVVEGESLINDGTALVAYKFAVAAVVTGSFSALDAGADFVVTVIGGDRRRDRGGGLIAAVRRRLDNPPVEVTIALLSAPTSPTCRRRRSGSPGSSRR